MGWPRRKKARSVGIRAAVKDGPEPPTAEQEAAGGHYLAARVAERPGGREALAAARARAAREGGSLCHAGRPGLPELGAVGFESPHQFAADATGPADGQWCACGGHRSDPRHR